MQNICYCLSRNPVLLISSCVIHHSFFHVFFSAGVGRTGCFIAASTGIEQIKVLRGLISKKRNYAGTLVGR